MCSIVKFGSTRCPVGGGVGQHSCAAVVCSWHVAGEAIRLTTMMVAASKGSSSSWPDVCARDTSWAKPSQRKHLWVPLTLLGASCLIPIALSSKGENLVHFLEEQGWRY
jgi:hypothetical protein